MRRLANPVTPPKVALGMTFSGLAEGKSCPARNPTSDRSLVFSPSGSTTVSTGWLNPPTLISFNSAEEKTRV
jgi:hypothetical protein